MKLLGSFFSLLLISTVFAADGAPMKALIIDGQNNHDYKATTPHLKKIIEETGLFTVDIATTPKGKDLSGFKPNFSEYKVIISNYNGEPWSKETEAAFEKYVREGGGFVSVHAADNAFPEWRAYNEMIGVGGWGGRNEHSGPYLRLQNGHFEHLSASGPGGGHGKQHAFLMETRAPEHPIMAGLPPKWMHAKDELYGWLRGPAENMTVLASALAAKEQGGSGEQEPLLMTITYGKGRVFHTALGHNNGPDITAQKCVGFITTLQRGVEWAATGNVSQKVPPDFPTAEKVSLRE